MHQLESLPKFRRLPLLMQSLTVPKAERKAWVIGKIGEFLVSRELRTLPRKFHKIYNNRYLKNDLGKYIQLDHIVVCSNGIIIVETKNLSGTVLGDESDSVWKQYVGDKCYNLPSPIDQNSYHVRCFESYLMKFSIPVYSVVCMTGFAEISVLGAQTPVVSIAELNSQILAFNRKCSVPFKTLCKIVEKITEKETLKIKREHLSSISVKKNAIDKQGQLRKCPTCGNPLVERRGRNGHKFVGCSKFPKCRFTSQ